MLICSTGLIRPRLHSSIPSPYAVIHRYALPGLCGWCDFFSPMNETNQPFQTS